MRGCMAVLQAVERVFDGICGSDWTARSVLRRARVDEGALDQSHAAAAAHAAFGAVQKVDV